MQTNFTEQKISIGLNAILQEYYIIILHVKTRCILNATSQNVDKNAPFNKLILRNVNLKIIPQFSKNILCLAQINRNPYKTM